jgi:1-aminocyclopropane-1-carboxylate deaminase
LDFLGAWDWQPYVEPLPFFPYTDALRLDKIHPEISGNKPLKLAGFVQAFNPKTHRSLLSFGGAHSNHLHALAYVARSLNIPAFLLVRGYEHLPLTPTLQDCQNLGAKLVFLDKKTYARRYEPEFWQELEQRYQALVIPEGGAGELGELGCKPLAHLAQHYEEVWLACGSGTTALGLAKGLAKYQAQTQVCVVNAVADQGERRRAFSAQMPKSVRWRLLDEAHLGGFAKITPELRDTIARYDAQGLPLDPVYTAKLCLAYESQASTRKALLIHTGGLQGRRVGSFNH